MKKLLFLFLVTFTLKLSAQKIIKTEQVTDHSIHIIGNNFEGIVFTKEFKADYSKLANDTTKSIWFTPTLQQITLTENILRTQLKNIDKKSKYRNGRMVKRNLNKYFQQYVGFINGSDEMIYINGVLKEILLTDHKYKKNHRVEDPGRI